LDTTFKVKGHQAALLTAGFTHQAAAAVSVGKYSPWEPTATLPFAGAAIGSVAQSASMPTEGGEGLGEYRGGCPPTACFCCAIFSSVTVCSQSYELC